MIGSSIRFICFAFIVTLQPFLFFQTKIVAQPSARKSTGKPPVVPEPVNLTVPLILCGEYKSTSIINKFVASDNIKDGTLLIPYLSGELEALDSRDAHRIWLSDLGGEIVSSIKVAGKNVFIVVRVGEEYQVKNLSKETGITVWQTKISDFGGGEKPVVDFFIKFSGNRLVSIFPSGVFFVFDGENGSLLQKGNAGAKLAAPPFFADNRFIVSSEDKRLSFFSNTDAVLLGKFESPVRVTTVAEGLLGILFAGDANGGVYALNATDNTFLWKARAGGSQISAVMPTVYGLIVSSFDNYLYLLSTGGGKRLWKVRMPGKIAFKPLLLGRYAVVSSLFDSSAVIIDLKIGKIVNRINSDGENFFSGVTPLFDGERLIFTTARGLAIYADSQEKCESVR